jgi:molybdopterin biosynthesis enzyme
MKWFTPLLLALSLAAGTIACMTAYSPRLAAVERAVAAGEEIELGAPSGRSVDAAGEITPIAAAGARLTPEIVATLRAAGVERVRVRQFSFARWSHAWMFAASAAGLAIGAVLVRREIRASRKASLRESGSAQSPVTALTCMRDTLRRLDSEMPALREAPGGMKRVTDEIGELQATHIDTILQSRDRIIATGGLSGFATFMSAFSVMERQINRAWSAAADDVPDEAGDSIRRALALMDNVLEALPRE